MLAAYSQQQQRGSRSTSNLNVFNRYPSSLSSACGALQPRLTSATSEEEDEDEDEDSTESISGSSEAGDMDNDEDERMILDGNGRGAATAIATATQPPRLQLQQVASSDTVTDSGTVTVTVNSNPLPHQPAPPAPIIVTYGPFHNPDVDVAVAYAQMVCYLWFWSPNASFDPAQWALQLQPHPHFIHFLGKVITQTQLSKTVLVLALHYLWLLKRPVMVGSGEADAAEEGAAGQEMGPVNRPSALAQAPADGSQYTVSVIALMLANKFMDDNTYTNKSWAAICGVTLEKINSMEREFLIAINHALHVDVNRFISWIRIMQSFFIQRQSRFDSRSRRIVRLPHHSNPYSQPNGDSGTQYRPTRAHSHLRMNVHSDDGHGHQSDVSLCSSASGNTNAVGYSRARSVSPKVFQFTFVPPTNTVQQQQQQQAQAQPQSQSQMSDNSLNVPLHHGSIRPFTGIDQRPSRPFTGQGYGGGSYATLYRDEMEALVANNNSTTTVVPSSSSSRAQQWAMDMSTPMEPSPILVNVTSSRSKRSASQAFSPKSAEPSRPRPRPEDRDRDRDRDRQAQSQATGLAALAHPHPVRRGVKPQFAGWNSHSHQHSNVYPYQEQQPHHSHQPHQYQYHPHLTSYPNPGGHHHRRMNQVHEILASSSRTSTAVEAGFARMSLSSSSHGPSPVSDAGPSRQHLYSQGSHSRSQLSLHSHSQLAAQSESQLIAPFDPYTAPTFRNEGATEDEPLRLQFYQLVQGGRGVLRCQPMVNVGLQVPSQGDVVYSEGVDVSPQEREYEYAMRERERERYSTGNSTMHPPSLAFSTTDDDEGMSSSESSNGTGWEYQHQQHPSHLHAHQQQQLHLQSQSQSQSQVVGGGYSLPPLSTLLAETQVQASQTPMHENVRYAEFANAGPPASFVPQWGLFSSPSGATPYANNAHRNTTTMTAFQSSAGMESLGLRHLDLPQSYAHPSQQYGRRVR